MDQQKIDQLEAIYEEGPSYEEFKLQDGYTIKFLKNDSDTYDVEFRGKINQFDSIEDVYEAVREGLRLHGMDDYAVLADDCISHMCPQKWYDEQEGEY